MRGLVLLLMGFIFLGKTGRGQYIFNSFQTRDGLSGKEVHCSFRDSEGFMWFGTSNGLCRFDGSNFKTFNQVTKKYIRLSNQTVTTVAEYGKNMIWVGTQAGLFRFSKDKEQFDTIQFRNEQKKLVPAPFVERILVDRQKGMWIATRSGLYIYKDGYAVPISELYQKTYTLTAGYITSDAIKEDTIRQGIWVGTLKGLYFISYKTREIWSAWNNPHRISIIDSTSVQSLAITKNGDLWISGVGFFLARYSFHNDSTWSTENINNDPRWTLRSGCNAMFVDSRDRFWVSTWNGKVFVKEPGAQQFAVLPDESPFPYQLPVGAFFDAYEDDKKNIWLGTYNGVSKLSSTGFLKNIIELPLNLFDPSVGIAVTNSIRRAGADSLWVCKDDGLYLVDLRNPGVTRRYFISATQKRSNRFFDMQWINNEWWCGTGDGIYTLNIHSGRFTRFTHYVKGHEVNQRSASWVQKDKQGYIWFNIWNDGVYRFDPRTKTTTRANALGDRTVNGINYGNSLCFYEHVDGRIWLGNGAKGIIVYDPVSNSYSLPGNNEHTARAMHGLVVNAIIPDKEKNIWVSGTRRGILKFDKSGNLVDSIRPEGIGSEGVTDMIIDRFNRLWFTTSEALCYLNPVTKLIWKLNVDVGPPMHDPVAAVQAVDDRLLAAVYNRMAVISLPEIDKIPQPAPPMITGIRLLGNEIPFATNQAELKFRHTENFFEIEFSSTDHRDISALQYAYRLKGFDVDWVYPGRRQTAAYTNVPSGNYTFEVKCTDGNGKWMDTVETIRIHIKPPFWKTAWFITAIVLLSAFISWKILRFRAVRIRRRNAEKSIDYFANSVYGENSVNEICWDIARNCISQLQFEDCVVYLLDPVTNKLVQKAAYGPKNPKGHEISEPIELEMGKGIVGTVATTGKPLLVNDTSKDQRYVVDDEQRFSELAVPVMHDGKLIGVIDSEHPAKNFFTADHLKALSTIASICANKIAEAQAREDAKETEMKVLGISKQLAESQLMALRAQMNPHFVFNCLNSIQECIVTQKYGEASDYLNKFSKLFRTVLNNSGKNLVSIDEEKEVMKLYLELELMRFERSFSYEIKVDEDLETDEILMPSMLLQPYVENALWHGLMHKEGERKVLVSFTKVSEDIFRCVIDDNGIGRKKSFELKEQQSKTRRHESKGLKITKDRIDILKQQGYHALLVIEDKTNDLGEAMGTRVIVELSTFLKPA